MSNPSTHTRQYREPLQRKTLLAYGSINIPMMMTDLAVLLYLPAYYAQDIGLDVGLIGVVFLVARLWDGVSDPLIGWLSDQSSLRLGRRKPWVIVGVPLLMLSVWFLFLPGNQVGFFYLSFWVLAFYTAQTMIKVPHYSWGAEMTPDYSERSRVVGFRESFSMVGYLLVPVVALIILPEAPAVREVLFLIVVMTLILLPLCVTPLIRLVPDQQRREKTVLAFSRGLKLCFKNKPFIRFQLALLSVYTVLGAGNALFLFMVDVGWGLPGTFLSLFLFQYIASIVALPLHIKLGKRFGKHKVLSVAVALLIVVHGVLFFAPQGSYLFIATMQMLAGSVFAAMFLFPTSILADIIDVDTIVSGEERAGVFMAAYNLTLKVGMALGIGIAYGYLGLLGYDPTSSVQTASDVLTLRTTYTLLAIFYLPLVFLLWKFPIDKTIQGKNRAIIESRHAQSERATHHRDTEKENVLCTDKEKTSRNIQPSLGGVS